MYHSSTGGAIEVNDFVFVVGILLENSSWRGLLHALALDLDLSRRLGIRVLAISSAKNKRGDLCAHLKGRNPS